MIFLQMYSVICNPFQVVTGWFVPLPIKLYNDFFLVEIDRTRAGLAKCVCCVEEYIYMSLHIAAWTPENVLRAQLAERRHPAF